MRSHPGIVNQCETNFPELGRKTCKKLWCDTKYVYKCPMQMISVNAQATTHTVEP